MQDSSHSGCSGDKCVEACEGGWEKNGDHCYFLSTEKKNWFAAEIFCQGEGGHLASVHSHATNDFVWERMNRKGLEFMWIGGIREENVFKWTDCTPWKFTVWAAGEPNNALPGEDCVSMYNLQGHEGSHKKWNDYQCVNELGFACSKKICSGRKYQNIQNLLAFFRSQHDVEAGPRFPRRDPPHLPNLLTV